MAESSTHTATTMMQLFSGSEIQVLILLSFALQVFLFFSGGLRRRNNHMLLRITIWLSYLSADFIAAYALGHLSRNLPTTKEENGHLPVTHQLTILWAPFLLIHLGGQDNVTAFSLEDNELWLRHLLNLVGQACLVVYVLWKWVALAQYQLVIPAAFLFVAGIIKYWERIWALKLGSQEGLRSSTSRDATSSGPQRVTIYYVRRPGPMYQSIIRYAFRTKQGVQDIFAGKKVDNMADDVLGKFFDHVEGREAGARFKRVEIELSIMYDGLFTKSRVIQKRHARILRCVALASTAVAFVLYLKMMMSSTVDVEQATTYNFDNRRRRISRFDAGITYILFIGAFFLEACSFFIVMMSPWALTVLEARSGWRVLVRRVAWPIFLRIQPETKPWWSNSMGQYNLLSSRFDQNRSKWSSTMVLGKLAGVFGASELWHKISNTKHAQVTMDIKELIHDSIGYEMHRPKCIHVPKEYRSISIHLFEEALVLLHFWTDVVLHKAGLTQEEEEEAEAEEEAESLRRRRLMDTCKRLSNYMMYLLVEHPAMLPVRTNIQDLLAKYPFWASGTPIKEGEFLESLAANPVMGMSLMQRARRVLENRQGIHTEMEILEQVWVRMLLYAAGKSRPEHHARRLSTGGELITFAWLLMARQAMGDVGNHVSLITEGERVSNALLDPNLT